MATTRGRPKALTYEFCQDIWVRFEFLRMRPRVYRKPYPS
jgi:hypothetical protein